MRYAGGRRPNAVTRPFSSTRRACPTAPEAWRLVTPQLRPATKLVGGIIGAAILVEWKEYRTVEQFAADQQRHRNELAWFEKPVLYGFVFRNAITLPFRRYPGWMRFFFVEDESPRQESSARS